MAAEKLPSYGGQALIEGVVMRGSHSVAAAMRAPNGEIILKTEDLKGIYISSIRKFPVIRGLIVLWDALSLGIRFLTLSANVQTGEDEKIEGPALYLTLGGAFAAGILIFFVAPAAAGHWIESLTGWNPLVGNLIEGGLRLAIMIGYIWGIGFMPDIRRVFEYHGAEHKTINAFEAGAKLTPETVKGFSLEHPRCGTSFLLIVVVFSIIIFTLLGPLPILVKLLTRVLLIPVVAGLAYEYIKWSANNIESRLIQWLIKPNLALQRLTTREPSLDVLEVAIAAFNTMLAREQQAKEQSMVL
ncbi:MAG: DUF1385 domain-containing protein [Anaerolineae bacterium]|nr:DUF1385 domain-containing protein [Anaerolineae bacterium]